MCATLPLIAFLSLVLSCAAFPLTTSSPAALRLLKSPSARCLDGTQAGYYIRAGSASSTSWVFSLEGGGECVSKDDCLNRANSTLGSSKSWLPTTELGQYQANDPIWNPRFFNAHHVFVKYCTGDLFIGGVTQPSSGTYGLYFSGRLIVEAVINELLSQGLSSASIVVWSGDSAGGIGAVATADFVAKLLPHTKVVAAPIGGFYFPPPVYTGPDRVPLYVDFSVASWSHICSVWQCMLPSVCAANHPSSPAACALGNYSLHYTTVPTFVVESQADKIAMLLHAGVNSTIDPPSQNMLPFIQRWQGIMIEELQHVAESLEAAKVPFSYFNPACWMHCEFSLIPKLGGTDFLHAFYAFLDVRAKPNRCEALPIACRIFNADFRLQGRLQPYSDDCGFHCNPTCPKTLALE